jgi:hypothetical protein
VYVEMRLVVPGRGFGSAARCWVRVPGLLLLGASRLGVSPRAWPCVVLKVVFVFLFHWLYFYSVLFV